MIVIKWNREEIKITLSIMGQSSTKEENMKKVLRSDSHEEFVEPSSEHHSLRWHGEGCT